VTDPIQSSHFQEIKKTLKRLVPPASLFNGVRIEQSFAPDNILVFRRTDTAALKPECVSNNYHHRFVLLCVLEKGGPARIDHASHEMQPGECALIFPHQFHHFMDVAKGPLEWIFITFDLAYPTPVEALRGTPRRMDDRAMGVLEGIIKTYTQQTDGNRVGLELAHQLSLLLLHLCSCQEIPADRQDIHSSDDVRDVILERINTYVRAHLREAVTISDLASELGYSVSHLRAVFRDRLGVSLGRYIRESRLSQAAQLLQARELNVSEVGETCGFESLFAFSRAFRKAYSVPPRAYRNLVCSGAPLPQPSTNCSGR
jgi:AraC-like DNA-binding protein